MNHRTGPLKEEGEVGEEEVNHRTGQVKEEGEVKVNHRTVSRGQDRG